MLHEPKIENNMPLELVIKKLLIQCKSSKIYFILIKKKRRGNSYTSLSLIFSRSMVKVLMQAPILKSYRSKC